MESRLARLQPIADLSELFDEAFGGNGEGWNPRIGCRDPRRSRPRP